MTHRYDAKFSVRIAVHVILVLRIKQQIKTVEDFGQLEQKFKPPCTCFAA